MTTSMFGLHLMLDAYESDPKKLDDMKLVFHFLNELPGIINMHKITTPMVVNASETSTGKDPGGISGFVMIAESHISIHTFPKRKFFTMDLYSCNDFTPDVDKVMDYVQKTFGFGKHELQLVKRGLEYPGTNLV